MNIEILNFKLVKESIDLKSYTILLNSISYHFKGKPSLFKCHNISSYLEKMH